MAQSRNSVPIYILAHTQACTDLVELRHMHDRLQTNRAWGYDWGKKGGFERLHSERVPTLSKAYEQCRFNRLGY